MHGESQQPPKKAKANGQTCTPLCQNNRYMKTWLRGEITLRLNQLFLGWLGVASADPSQLQQPYALQFRRPRPHDGVTQSASNYGTAVTLAFAETSCFSLPIILGSSTHCTGSWPGEMHRDCGIKKLTPLAS